MKNKALLAVILAFVATSAFAQTSVRGYTKKDGTYVAPHYRSSPNSTRNDNYSTRGNVNPYTGKEGTRDPEAGGYSYTPPKPAPVPSQSTYSQPTTVPNPYGLPAQQSPSLPQVEPIRSY